MFSQIAQVFSSQGVLRPGIERIPVYGKPKTAPAGDVKDASSGFAAKFDQASAKLQISKQGQQKNAAQGAGKAAGDADGQVANAAAPKKPDGKPLSQDEQKQVEKLQKTDREVKAHEAAHEANSGGHAQGAPSYEYSQGPDGKQYAVGGHVDIDVSPVRGNPQATLEKAQTVQRAALAPADPSGADRAVAAAASQMAVQAQKELARDQGEKNGGSENPASDPRRAYSRSASRVGSGLNIVG